MNHTHGPTRAFAAAMRSSCISLPGARSAFFEGDVAVVIDPHPAHGRAPVPRRDAPSPFHPSFDRRRAAEPADDPCPILH